MKNRRKEKRAFIQVEGFFVHHSALWEVKLRDVNSGGVGLYCNRSLPARQQGILCARLPSSPEQESIPARIIWCKKEPHPEDPFYSYRLGLRLIKQQPCCRGREDLPPRDAQA